MTDAITLPANVQAWITRAKLAVKTALSYVLHLGLAWVISWGLRHGFHLDTGYLGLSFLSYFGTTAAGLCLNTYSEIHGKAAERGRLAAQTEYTVAAYAAAAKVGLGSTSKPTETVTPSGAYI